jgi:hypothetical protein
MMLRLRPLCPRLWRPCSVRLPRMVSGCLPKEGHAVAGPLASPVTSVGRRLAPAAARTESVECWLSSACCPAQRSVVVLRY